MERRLVHRPNGYTFLEIVLALTAAATLMGIALPLWSNTVDHLRASGAARYLAGRIAGLRIDAVRRSSTVAFRFERVEDDYSFRPYVDGNGNGLRMVDVSAGIDRPLAPAQRLSEQFPHARLGLLPGIPDLDGAVGSTDGVRIGASSFLSLSPDGSATSGTLYMHGRRAQYAVRILGATGRMRFYQYDPEARRWNAR